MFILDNTTGYSADSIASFNYNSLLRKFHKPLELRKNNWNEYPHFGKLFTETHQDKFAEIEAILHSDLKEFVKLK